MGEKGVGEIEESNWEGIVQSFFVDPKRGNSELSITPIDGLETIGVEATIKTCEKDSEDIPRDFSFGIKGEAVHNKRREGLDDCLSFQRFNLIINGKDIGFEDLCPPGIKLILDNRSQASYNYENAEIVLSSLASPDDLVSLFHEIGHATDFKKRRVKNTFYDLERYGLAIQERNAWAEALKIAKKYKMPILKYMKNTAQASLGSHEKSDGRAITDKTRKERRKE